MRFVAVSLALMAVIMTAGARDLLQAPAPSPASNQPAADILFILSAGVATFPNATTLQLKGISSTVQFFDAGAKGGLISTANFTNSSAGADYVDSAGAWLSGPDATLFTLGQNGQNEALLLLLGNPKYDAQNQMVTFNITVLPAQESTLKLSNGVANEIVMDNTNNVGTPLVTAVQPGAVWNNVALFIDENNDSLGPMAETKAWWWWHHGGYYNRGYGRGRWNHGYGRH